MRAGQRRSMRPRAARYRTDRAPNCVQPQSSTSKRPKMRHERVSLPLSRELASADALLAELDAEEQRLVGFSRGHGRSIAAGSVQGHSGVLQATPRGAATPPRRGAMMRSAWEPAGPKALAAFAPAAQLEDVSQQLALCRADARQLAAQLAGAQRQGCGCAPRHTACKCACGCSGGGSRRIGGSSGSSYDHRFLAMGLKCEDLWQCDEAIASAYGSSKPAVYSSFESGSCCTASSGSLLSSSAVRCHCCCRCGGSGGSGWQAGAQQPTTAAGQEQQHATVLQLRKVRVGGWARSCCLLPSCRVAVLECKRCAATRARAHA